MDKPGQVSVSLSMLEREIVEKASDRRGIFTFSGMLRIIIREWDEMQQQGVKNGNGRQVQPCADNPKRE